MTDWTLAACRGLPTEAFFADTYVEQKLAKRVCKPKDGPPCPIALQCLQEALRDQLEGIWAATTTEERAAIRRRQQRRKAVA